MILAAGRGKRMGELTATTPKPLIRVGGHYLIEYMIARLKQAGITEIVINVSYHAKQIKTVLGNGAQYGVNFFFLHPLDK
jgi:MurNAc alpha-1-phosphate uridylyltransferase